MATGMSSLASLSYGPWQLLSPSAAAAADPWKRPSAANTSCTTSSSSRQEQQQRQQEQHEMKMDRRRFFVATSSSASAAALAATAAAAPIQTGSRTCKPASLPDGAEPDNCCPPAGSDSTPSDFVPPPSGSLPLRVRPAAHLAGADYVARYNRAYELLRALPDSDPRSYVNQANTHCAYCNDALLQADGRSTLQIHDSWLFLPWHRWFLYFHERILATLLRDDTFALPFWNWDDQQQQQLGGSVIPSMYLSSPALLDPLRDRLHLPPRAVDLNYDGTETGGGAASQRRLRSRNSALMYQQLVSAARTPSLFMGQPYRAGNVSRRGRGTLENAPHGPVHLWTGSSTQPNREDMGTLYAAARDPIFYAHHANIDRLWNVWKTLPGGRRRDFTDLDWVNATFLFYDEKANLVRVRVGDALDTVKQLRYRYQDVQDAWVSARPPCLLQQQQAQARAPASSSRGSSSSFSGSGPVAVAASNSSSSKEEIEEFGEAAAGKRQRLEKLFRSRVSRKPMLQQRKRELLLRSGSDDQGELEEVLVIEGVELEWDKATKFDVFINLLNADEATPTDCAEYAGTFVNVPHHRAGSSTHASSSSKRETTLHIGIGDKLEQLGITDAEHIVVTLVPKGFGKQNPVTFKGIKIEYD